MEAENGTRFLDTIRGPQSLSSQFSPILSGSLQDNSYACGTAKIWQISTKPIMQEECAVMFTLAMFEEIYFLVELCCEGIN